MSLDLQFDTVHLGPDDEYPFSITAKRYTCPALGAHADHPEALTLVLLHSTGFHKETWEPTLQELFGLMFSRHDVPVLEAWSIECPNHGASAELNEDALRRLPESISNFTCEKYAVAVHRFLSAESFEGANVDFRRRNLIGIGHSLGGVAMAVLQQLVPRIEFQAVILVEPMLSPGGPEHLQPLRVDLVRGAYERRDVWPSRQHALEALKQRGRTRMWDPRMLEVFVKYGLRTHPGARFTDTPYNGVTLCCSREQEAVMYRDVDGPTKPVSDLNDACARLPIHVIFGAINDYIPREVHLAIIDPTSPRQFASISHVENAGHLVPHQAPGALAKVILVILEAQIRGNKNPRANPVSKL
ncbi:hypothetical protein M0805_004981 [Coniferiporia weirii]|nr:hypothetical protein M0805_004981 [Coniferiporia weirii]